MEKNKSRFYCRDHSFPLTWGKGQRVFKNEKNLGIAGGISAMLGLARAALSDQASRDGETPKPGVTTN